MLTTRGYLSNGISYETTIEGNGDDDEFTVFRNTADLTLLGGNGDDTFTIRAFALEGSHTTELTGEGGADYVEYVINAPVHVYGGDGNDTLLVIGTEFSDQIVVTDTGVYGMGVTVDYHEIEFFKIDAAEGNDTFYVLSTAAAVETWLYGGLGSDRFSIAGDVPQIMSGLTEIYPETPGSHKTDGIKGLLHIEGMACAGSAGGLGIPVMLPGETNTMVSDGGVVAYAGTGEPSAIDTMTVNTADLSAVETDFDNLIGKTLEISEGPGIGRFWQIVAWENGSTVGTTILELKNPSMPAAEWELPNDSSEFAITHLSANFFVVESDQVDFATVYNDGATVDQTGTLTDSSLTGLDMGPGITYGSLETLDIFLGSGIDTFSVTSTMKQAEEGFSTVTMLNTGAGNDAVTVSLSTANDGFFALNTEEGDDAVHATESTLPLVIFGGEDNDTIESGQGNDIIFGDKGRIDYRDSSGKLVTRLGLGLDERNVLQPGESETSESDVPFKQTDAIVRGPALITTRDASVGGSDTIYGNNGSDIVLGGDAGDTVEAGEGDNIVVGDSGHIAFSDGHLTLIETTEPSDGGADSITTGTGYDILLGGIGNDMIIGNSGETESTVDSGNIVIGDNGLIQYNGTDENPATLDLVQTTAPEVGGGNDTITTGRGNDIIIGGDNDSTAPLTVDGQSVVGDLIQASDGDNVILCDNGWIGYYNGKLDLITSTEAGTETTSAQGGDDRITTGTGNDTIVAGYRTDTVTAGSGNNLVIGDSGTVDYVQGTGALSRIETIAPAFGGIDSITTNGGDDTILGGQAGDTINAGEGHNIVLGDDGFLDYVNQDGDPSDIDEIASTSTNAAGGSDDITTGDGDDIVIGGRFGDTINARDGDNLIIGDSGWITAANDDSVQQFAGQPMTFGLIETITTDDGGSDDIDTLDGDDIILGGYNDSLITETIDAGEGNNIVLGDNGLIDYTWADRDLDAKGADTDAADIDRIWSIDPGIGGTEQITTGDGDDIVIGGSAADTITVNNGDNLVIGDSGNITAATTDTVQQFAGHPMTFGLIETTAYEIGGGDTITSGTGYDIVLGGHGDDTITVSDLGLDPLINALGGDNNIVLGDDGKIDYTHKDRDASQPGADTNPADIDLIESTSTTDAGGVDTINTGDGDDIVIGGRFGDTINARDGDNLIIGDSGRITAASADGPQQFGGQPMTFGKIETIEFDGGVDTITTLSGYDIVFGGDEGDIISVSDFTEELLNTTTDHNIVLGDDGQIDYVREERDGNVPGADTDPSDIDLIESLSTNYAGGIDTIDSGDGQDIVIGGRFGDTINARDGDNLIIGDSGRITAANADAPQFAGQPMTFGLIETVEYGDGGVDTISTLTGYDIVLGGHEGDIITVSDLTNLVTDDHNIVLGDDGQIDYTRADRETVAGADIDPTDIDLIESTSTAAAGGADIINTGYGDDIVIGGRYGDNIEARNGDNLVFGDSGRILAADANTVQQLAGQPMTLGQITTIQPDDGGQDHITTGDDNDIILGGFESDTIVAGGDDDWILGDNGLFRYDQPSDDVTNLGRPDVVAYLGDTTLTLDSEPLPDPSTLDLVQTTDPTLGNDDVIYGNAGNDVIFGGTGRDRIWGDSDMDNQVNNATDGDGADIIFGDHAKIYPHLPNLDPFFINNNFFSIDTSEVNGFDTDGVVEYAPGADFEDIIFGSGNDDTIIGGQDDDILYGGGDNDILIGGHNVVGGHDEIDDMDQALKDAILTGVLLDMDPSDVNDINDVMDGGSQNDVMAGDNAIIIRQVDSTSPRYQLLTQSEIYSMVIENMGGLFDIDVGYSPNIQGDPQLKPGSDVGYTVILLDHSEDIATTAAQSSFQARVFGNDVMAGGSEDDEMFGQLGDDIMQGDGSIDLYDGDPVVFDPSPAADPSFTIPDNQSVTTWFEVDGQKLLFHVSEAETDGDDYMEGNGGNDRMYGNFGQDDMIGGNSILFGLDDATADFYDIDPETDFARPDGADMIYGGAGDPNRLSRNNPIFDGSSQDLVDTINNQLKLEAHNFVAGDEVIYRNGGGADIGGLIDGETYYVIIVNSDTIQLSSIGGEVATLTSEGVGTAHTLIKKDAHARDADVIMGDNANIYRLVTSVDLTDDSTDNATIEYLQFAYDQMSEYEDRGALRIVPRAVELIDYQYTYTDPNNEPTSLFFMATGVGDLIYGESGDDIIHGMTGDDVLFGNSENDDLYGEAGSDWISGGNGEDGILGDDGLIKTSRNDLVPEPFYSIDALNPEQTLIKKNDPVDTNALNAEISTPGNIQRAIINVEGALKKTVDLLAFDAGLAGVGVNDIIYGGLNDDFIHAGAGDDAVSGAEALPVFYTAGEVDVDGQGLLVEINELLQIQQNAPINDDPDLADNPFWFEFAPYNPGDILRYEGNTASDADDPHGKTTQEFALYDEFYPRRKIMLNADGEAVELADDAIYDFLLNFNEDEGPIGYDFLGDDAAMMTDGDDKIFGDLDHDWIIGGTGRDHMYGGRGDDLLNMDDNHDSGSGGKVGPHDPPPDPLDNTMSDEYQAYADIAYGGAGRDVLILNTGADRAIDWVGEYNSYIVPFSPFGAFHISRTLQPQLPEFLCYLSAGDGIDTTVPDGARYVEQKGLDVRIDPPDPLRQGEPYGELGMVRQMDFDWHNQTGAPNDPQPGNLQGKREIMRRELFQDSVEPKGAFAETEGIWTANDGKLEAAPVILGEDAVSIYHLDQMQPSYMEALVTINAEKDMAGFKSNAYIIFDYQSPTDFKFAGVDVGIDKIQIGHYTIDGWIVDMQTPMQLKANTDYDLTLVMYGTMATIWVDGTVSLNFDFSDPLYDFGMIGLATNNAVARFDDWQVQKLPPTLTFQFSEDFAEAPTNPFEEQMGDWMITDGHYNSGTVVEGDRAITTWAIEVATWSLLEFEALINTGTTGGLIFDYYDADNFKFAAIDAIADHDQVMIGHHTSKGWFIDASADASIETGTSYNLGISMLGTSVSVTLNDQAVVGHVFNSLLTDGFIGLLSKDGATLFDDVVVQGDDPAYAENLTAAAVPDVFIEPISFLTYDDLAAIVDEAIERWTDALGIDDALAASLHEVSFQIVDFSDLTLGRAFEDTILIDADAAGYGWFVDTTPYDDVEFSRLNEEGELGADSASDAYGDMDLLTVVMHELGHVLGLEDLDPDTHDLMSETLDPGVRQLADDHINADNAESVEVNEADDLASLIVMDTAINEAEAIAPAQAAAAKHGSSWLAEFLTNGTGKRYNKFDPKDDIKIVLFDDDEEND